MYKKLFICNVHIFHYSQQILRSMLKFYLNFMKKWHS